MDDVLVVGSLAFDSVGTPFGKAVDVLGGAASFFSLAAGIFAPVRLVAAVGSDFPEEYLAWFRDRNVDLTGLQRSAEGATFRWIGDYGFDLNVAHTIDTQLNVYADFHPTLPPGYRDSRFVYLANIMPALQLEVLDQVRDPLFVGLDSMNLWIENPVTKAQLGRVIERVDAVFMNDAEIRAYTGEYNLLAAARSILARGPRVVLIKKGEHGSIGVAAEGIFTTSAFPLESPRDPTGAGDAFAGALMGHLAATGDTSWAGIRRGIAYGNVVASFTVEAFSVERLRSIDLATVRARYGALQQMSALEQQVP